MGLYKTKKLLKSKRNHQQNKMANKRNGRVYLQTIALTRGKGRQLYLNNNKINKNKNKK